MKGIDVSKWQGVIDFNKVKESGMEFVIIRAGYGKSASQKDPYFEQNYAGAKAAGLFVGAYWYSYAESVEDAKREAAVCLDVIKGKQFDLPIYYDVEEKKQFDRGKNFCDSIITAFCDMLEAAGYFVGVYMSASYLNNYVTDYVRKRYTVWIAQYASKCTYKDQYGIWQYSSKGSVPGVKGNCDMDECYIDFPATMKNCGYNGYSKMAVSDSGVSAPAEKSVDDIAKEVIAGKWGNDPDRKNRITEAGYDYSAVRKRVNELMKK